MPPPVHASRLEKAAFDNGFDLERPTDGGWLCYGSSQCSLRIWLRVTPGGVLPAAQFESEYTVVVEASD